MMDNKVIFSVFAARKSINKVYHYVNGKADNQGLEAATQISESKTMSVYPHELPDLFSSLKPNHAIGCGISDKEGVICSKGNEGNPGYEGQYSRSQDNFYFPKSPGLLLLDVDYGNIPLDSFFEILHSIEPATKGCAKFVRYSSSAGIYKDDKLLTPENKYHVYLLIDDLSQSKRVGDAIYQKLWLAGHGRIEISKAGAALDRSLVDASVWTPERLVVESEPTLKDGLKRCVPDPIHYEGGLLKCSDVVISDEDQEQAKRLIDEAKLKEKPKADVVAKKYVRKQSRKLSDSQNISLKDAENIVRERRNGSISVYDVVTTQSGEQKSVRQLIKDGKQVYCCDPAEPWEGNARASFNPGGIGYGSEPKIHSFLHGGIDYTIYYTKKNFNCKETRDSFWNDYKDLKKRREAGHEKQCEYFAFLLAKSCLYRIGRSLPDTYDFLSEFCTPSDELIDAVQYEIDQRKEHALSHTNLTHDYLLKRDKNNRLDLDYGYKLALKSDHKMSAYCFDHGSNKTQGIAAEIAAEMGSSVWVSHRAVLAHTTASKVFRGAKVPLASYQDVEANVSPHVSVCINSIPRFETQKARVLIIDEASQVLTHFAGDAWRNSNDNVSRQQSLDSLKMIGSKAQRIVLLDADLTDYVIQAYKEIFNCDCLVIANEPSITPREADITFVPSGPSVKKEWLLRVQAARREGLKVIAPFESADSAKAVTRNLRKLGANVLLLHGESEVKNEFSNNPDQYIEEYQPDVFIYTSVIGSGVSLEAGYFDVAIPMISSGSMCAEDLFQMFRRDRTVTKFQIIYGQSNRNKGSWCPLFKGFYTQDVAQIINSGKKNAEHGRMFNEEVLEHLLEKRNFSVSFDNKYQITPVTSSKEIKEQEALEISNAQPEDIKEPRTITECRQRQALEIHHWMGKETFSPEKLGKVSYDLALAYRMDKAKFKRGCILRGTLDVDLMFLDTLETVQDVYRRLSDGIADASSLDTLADMQDFLIRYDLLPTAWYSRNGKRFPKKRVAQALSVLADHWGIEVQPVKSQPKPEVSPKQAQLAKDKELVRKLYNQHMGIKKISAETGLSHNKTQRLLNEVKAESSDMPRVLKSENKCQGIYIPLADNQKNSTPGKKPQIVPEPSNDSEPLILEYVVVREKLSENQKQELMGHYTQPVVFL